MLRFDFVGRWMHISSGLVFGIRVFLELYIHRFAFPVKTARYVVMRNAYAFVLFADLCVNVDGMSFTDLVMAFPELVSI